MANAAITTLINDISTVVLNSTATDTYQEEIFFELARGARPDTFVQTGASFVEIIKNVGVYDLPAADGARTLLALIFDERVLGFSRYDEAMFFDPQWRKTPGRPVAYILDTIDRTKFALIPTPAQDGVAVGANTPTVSSSWPNGNITVIYMRQDTAFDGTNLLDIYPAIAFDVIARELGRDSDHMDPDAATLAQQFADLFWQLSFPPGV